jgi:SAM-dependent methyltransferase
MSDLMATPVASLPAVVERALELFEPDAKPAEARMHDGYLDLLGERNAIGSHRGQRAALSRLTPLLYGPLIHPLVVRMVGGLKAPGTREEERIAVRMLDLSPGDRVLDVACGPGNITRCYAQSAGDGLVVGLDASPAMLAYAARRTRAQNVAYVRSDAATLPFRSESFDAVACFGALHLFGEPMKALEEIVRVVVPGGRVGLLASCELPSKSRGKNAPRRSVNGMLVFERDDITDALREHGLVDIDQRIMRMMQMVSARKPA